MKAIRSLLAAAAIVAVALADEDDHEERARTDVSLGEFDLEDQCYNKAESEWEFLTSPPSQTTLQAKIREELQYGITYRDLAQQLGPYSEKSIVDFELVKKIELIKAPGDPLMNETQYEKEVIFSNTLQQIKRKRKVCSTKKPCQGVEQILATSRDGKLLLETWTKYQERFSSAAEKFPDVLQLTKAAAEANDEVEVDTYWQEQTEYPGGYTKAQFLWKRIEPLYQKLHSFVAKQLSKHHTLLNSTNTSLIPIHLLGSVSGSDWTNIATRILHSQSYHSILESMREKGLGGEAAYRAAEGLLDKLGLGTLSQKFWKQSWFNSSCPATLVNYCKDGDARVLTCNLTGWRDYLDAFENAMKVKHYELANYENTFIFWQNNHYSPIYEAVGGLSSLLATTPQYLQKLGLLTAEDATAELTKASLMLLTGLHTLPRLSYYLAADLWRIEIFTENITNVTQMNISWRKFRKDMQMVSIPEQDNIYDFLPDDYIASNKPYLGKFSGIILQFHLLEKILEENDLDSTDPDNTDIFFPDNALKLLLQSGKSANWKHLLEDIQGIDELDAGPLLSYFSKLESYLAKLEKLKPIKSNKYTVKSTTTAPKRSVILETEDNPSFNNSSDSIVLEPMNSTISTEEDIVDTNVTTIAKEKEKQTGSGTVILFACVAIVAAAVVIGCFYIGHKRFKKARAYRQTSTREI